VIGARTALVGVALSALTSSCSRGCGPPEGAGDAGGAAAPPYRGPPRVWAIDDGERVARKAGALPFLEGRGNPVWAPGRPLRLFGLPGETVAFQIVITAGPERPLGGVRVELDALEGPARLDAGPAGARFRTIERFVVHDVPMARRSGGVHAGESLGWARGSMPDDGAAGGALPEPLIPVEIAPAWCDYPMRVEPGEHRAVWFDVTLPDALPAGTYRGTIAASEAGAGGAAALGEVPIELEVGATPLPYAALATMVYYEPREILASVGAPEAVTHYLQLLHRHHLSTFYTLVDPRDVAAQLGELSGRTFTAEAGYAGPGAGRGVGLGVVGSYGMLREPSRAKVPAIAAVIDALEREGLGPGSPGFDAFLYAIDEQCESPWGAGWRKLLDESGHAGLRRLRVGHTCGDDPAKQPVDLALVPAERFDPAAARRAQAAGKTVWVYNGRLPQSGGFLSDAGTLSARANGWLQARHDVGRWFYWESTYWSDKNPGGHGPYDPFATAETFHNKHGDWANGDGVLVYPGTQTRYPEHSLGFAGVVPSLRLKQWRRGLQDGAYLRLARARDAARADAVAARLVGKAFGEARDGQKAPWAAGGAAYFAARRELFELIGR
jgi:glycosyl hydrolase family 123